MDRAQTASALAILVIVKRRRRRRNEKKRFRLVWVKPWLLSQGLVSPNWASVGSVRRQCPPTVLGELGVSELGLCLT